MVGEYRTTLKAFSRALAREAHVLTRQPDLLWEQLYNRLQWEEEAVKQTLTSELALRNALGCQAMAAARYPLPGESEVLIRTLEGHTG
jgi:hypothetical protein